MQFIVHVSHNTARKTSNSGSHSEKQIKDPGLGLPCTNDLRYEVLRIEKQHKD